MRIYIYIYMITQIERPIRSKSGDFLIGDHQGVQLVSCAADELKIRQLMAAFERALDRCEDTMRYTGHPILCWLSTSSRFDQRPFTFLGRAATRQRYRRLFGRFIPFLFRAYNIAPAIRVSWGRSCDIGTHVQLGLILLGAQNWSLSF